MLNGKSKVCQLKKLKNYVNYNHYHTHQALINGREYYIGDRGLLPKTSTKYIQYIEAYDIIGAQASTQDTIEIRVYNRSENKSNTISDENIGTLDYILLTIPGEK